MGLIRLTFTPPSPPPINGYYVKYREVGTVDWSVVSPNPTGSPIEFVVPDGRYWEGTIEALCDAHTSSTPVSWSVDNRGAIYDLVIGKFRAGDKVDVMLHDWTNGADTTYEVAGAIPSQRFENVFTPGHQYSMSVFVVPSGRFTAGISVSNDAGNIGACSGCTGLETPEFYGSDGEVSVNVSL